MLAGDAAPQQRAAPTPAYVPILERYAAGDGDGAAKAMLALEINDARQSAEQVIDDIESEMLALRRLDRDAKGSPGNTFLNGLRRKRLRTLKLALLVHTEAGLRTTAPQGQLLIAAEMANRLWSLREDFLRNGAVEPPAGEARATLVAGEAEWSGVHLFVRDWYLLVVSQFATLGQLQSLERHVHQGLTRFKDDPELLLARGTVYEQDAESSIVDRSLMRQIYPPSAVARWRLRLYDARDDYARARRATPAPAEASLRWGRIQGIFGETSAAMKALSEVAASAAPAYLRYLAHLFRAELREQAGDAAAARADHEAALGLWPSANAPKLALSRLAMASGDPTAARQWLARSFGEASPDRTDPWWDYLQGQAWRGDDRLASFRQRGLSP
jgi:hypothetical protein